MGNTNSTPNNPENPDQNNENNNPDTPAVNSSSITEEEARFSNVYSLGGTRFEVDKQRFLFGDSTDLNLICKHSLNFYAANNAKNTGAGDAIKREKNKIKNKQIQQDKALKEALSKNSYLDNVQVNSLKNTPYTSNDSQVIVNPIHLLINIRRTSVRLVPKIDTKTKKPIPSIYKLNFIYDAMVTCSIKMDLYECLSDFNPNMTNTQPIMKVYRTEKLKSDVAVKFENFKDSPDLDMTEIMTSLKKLGTNKEGSGSSSSSSFYLIITIYRICQEARADKNFQEQTTFIHIDQVNEGLSKTDNWVIKSVRQICQVGKIQFFLQDIYGIENKKKLNKEKTAYETGGAVTANLAAGIPGLDDSAGKHTSGNKDPQPDDEDTSCVVCLSEPRDTVMLPCRHLCMCSPCADKLRYQHGTCPFCRNPFQALLRIKAIKNGKTRREYSLADSLNGLQKEKKSKRKNKRSKDKDGKDGGGDANGHGKSGRGEISEEKLARARERKRKKEEKKRREKEGGSSKPEPDTIEYEGTGFGVSSSKPKSTSKSKNENSKTRNKSPDPPKSKARSNANAKDAKDSKLNSKTRSDQKDDKNKNQSKSKSKSKSKKEKSPSPPPESDLSETDTGSIETDDDDNFNSAMSQTADFDSDTSMVNHTMGSLSDKDDFSDNEFKDLDGDGMSESRVTVQRNNKKR